MSRGILWPDILRENARKEFEKDPETVNRFLIGGRDAVLLALEKQRQQIQKESGGGLFLVVAHLCVKTSFRRSSKYNFVYYYYLSFLEENGIEREQYTRKESKVENPEANNK